MSFLIEASVRRMATIPRTLAVSSVSRASFTTTVQLHKSATETVKDSVKSVDRAVSDKLVDGIDLGGEPGLLSAATETGTREIRINRYIL